jgi:hypothetical protein
MAVFNRIRVPKAAAAAVARPGNNSAPRPASAISSRLVSDWSADAAGRLAWHWSIADRVRA